MNNKNHIHVAKSLIEKFKLDLNCIKVLTECASKGYAYTPIIAGIAGAKSITAVGSDSSYGLFENNAKNILKIAETAGLDPSIFKFVKKHN